MDDVLELRHAAQAASDELEWTLDAIASMAIRLRKAVERGESIDLDDLDDLVKDARCCESLRAAGRAELAA